MTEVQGLISTLDWGIFLFVIIATISIVFITGRDNKFIDYMIMGRKLTLPLFIMTLVSSWYGGIIGVTSIAYENGIYNFITQGLFWYISYIVFALFMVDRIIVPDVITLPEFIGKKIGPKSEKLSGILNFISLMPIVYIISLGVLLNLLTGLDYFYSIVIGTLFVISYSAFGGFKSVVTTDAIQFFIMILAVLLVVAFSFFEYGLSPLKYNLPDSHYSITGNQSLLKLLAWGVVALSTLVDPTFYQRCFAINNKKLAKKGILISTFIWFCFDICTTLGGLYARAIMPDLDSNQAYLIYALNTLPVGFKGIFLAGIFSTIISTMDSFLFLGSTSLSYDVFNIKNKQLKYHRVTLILIGFICILLSWKLNNIENIWLFLGSISASCILLPLAFQLILNIKISDNEFFAAALAGFISIVIWEILNHLYHLLEIPSLFIGILSTTTVLCLSLLNKRLVSST
jgi:SSS family solute:Na+ symporter